MVLAFECKWIVFDIDIDRQVRKRRKVLQHQDGSANEEPNRTKSDPQWLKNGSGAKHIVRMDRTHIEKEAECGLEPLKFKKSTRKTKADKRQTVAWPVMRNYFFKDVT